MITATVEVNFPDGKRTIIMVRKKGHDIEECDEGKVVILNLVNNDSLTGIFKGMAGDDVKLGSLDGKHTLGYNVKWVRNYFEETK